MSHTPGPWTAATDTPYKLAGPVGPMFQVEAYPQSPYWIAYVQATPEGRNNARLISAAPELLEALKDLVDGIEDAGGRDENGDVFDIAKACAAIAKATGGTR